MQHPRQLGVLCSCRSAHRCGCGAGSYKGEVRRGILTAVARVKEGDAQRTLEHELLTSVELLEHAAHAAMAALLLVLHGSLNYIMCRHDQPACCVSALLPSSVCCQV